MDKFLWYFEQGGILMYPLALVSILALAVIVERAIRLRWNKLFDPMLIEAVQKHIESKNYGEAEKSCAENKSLAARVLGSAVKEVTNTETNMETALEESGQRELQVLNNNLSVLSTVSRVAPLMGLLGTVFGMIGAFDVLSEQGVGKEQMAYNIRVALITTATGLIIAIPTVIADAYFRSRIRKIVAHFEEIFIDIVKSSKITQSSEEKKLEA